MTTDIFCRNDLICELQNKKSLDIYSVPKLKYKGADCFWNNLQTASFATSSGWILRKFKLKQESPV